MAQIGEALLNGFIQIGWGRLLHYTVMRAAIDPNNEVLIATGSMSTAHRFCEQETIPLNWPVLGAQL